MAVSGFHQIFPWGLVSMCTDLGGHRAGLPPRLTPTTEGHAELEGRDPSRSDLRRPPPPLLCPSGGGRDAWSR